jgi:predicted aminopeptidase
MTYIFKQAAGQVDLELDGRENNEVLKDKKVSVEHKEKIKQILKYKKFFYDYFQVDQTSIYDKTTFLGRDAVSYLVIASPKNKIKALTHSFPFIGEFPYLGFFNKKDAKDYSKELEKKNYDVYIRKVYAYSTLDQLFFKDNILSSFFIFDNEELAELIFHELFHTIFFIENEVELNENMAQFISSKLVKLYYADKEKEIDQYIIRKQKAKKLHQKISELTKTLSMRYKKTPNLYEEVKSAFFKEEFKPELKKECKKLQIKKCWPLKREWNNASLVAFLTYESSQSEIEKFFQSKNLPPLKFVKFLKKNIKHLKN